MAVTTTTLAAAMRASDLTAVLTSATGADTGRTILIGGEFMRQAGPAVGTVIPVQRGLDGSAQIAHAAATSVSIGLASDFPVPSTPSQASVYTDQVTITGDGSSARPLVSVGDGTGDVTASGTLTNNTIMLGGGAKVVKSTTTGTGIVTALGVNTGSAGAPVLFDGAGGTPSSIDLTNASGTAAGLTAGTASAVAVGGITGLGTGVGAALAINVGSAGAPVVLDGDGGTPSALVGTNITGTAAGLTAGAVAVGGITGLGTGVGAALAIALADSGGLAANGVGGVANAYRLARGASNQAAASDTIATGLTTVVAVVVAPVTVTVKQLWFTSDIGDQAGSPAAGSFLRKSFKPTAVDNCTPTAATDFSDNISVNWIAIGT